MLKDFEVFKEEGFEYMETRGGTRTLMLLHGLMGALSNFEGILKSFGKRYNVVIPILPIFTMPIRQLDLDGLVDYIQRFVNFKGFKKVDILGNSLGGHLCQMYCLRCPDKVRTMTLTGSSGLFENAMGSTYPRRGSMEYIRKKTEMVFFDPKVATDELVNEVYELVQDLGKCIRVVKTAKSAVRHNLEDKLKDILAPTLLVWGNQDEVTPKWVGEKYHELLPDSQLVQFDKCGHAPMMEHPEEFNKVLDTFLDEHKELD